MRFTLIPQLSTKDGEANKNARMTNTLAERNQTGAVFGCVRPGLSVYRSFSGAGNGIVELNGDLLAFFANKVYMQDGTEIATAADTYFDFAQSTL